MYLKKIKATHSTNFSFKTNFFFWDLLFCLFLTKKKQQTKRQLLLGRIHKVTWSSTKFLTRIIFCGDRHIYTQQNMTEELYQKVRITQNELLLFFFSLCMRQKFFFITNFEAKTKFSHETKRHIPMEDFIQFEQEKNKTHKHTQAQGDKIVNILPDFSVVDHYNVLL